MFVGMVGYFCFESIFTLDTHHLVLIHDNQGNPKNTTINVVYKEVFANL